MGDPLRVTIVSTIQRMEDAGYSTTRVHRLGDVMDGVQLLLRPRGA